jgi:DNA-binding NtrC family response regulator
MSLGQRVDALVEQGLLSEALTQLRSESSIPLQLSATLVHLQSHVGDLLKAQAAAELLLKKELDPRSSALCKEVIGRSLLVHGRSQADGLRLLLEARSTAQEKLGAVEHARYSCGYVDALLHRIGISEAVSELPKLRKIVLVSGDAFALAVMHILQAEVRTKQGQLAKAAVDLRMTHDLLSRQANLVLEGKWALASSARAVLDGSVSEARALAEHAISCADQSGSIPLKIPSLGTLAHVLLISGHLDLCERKLAEASKMARPGGATLIGLQDTRLQLLIARGSSEEADSFADKLFSLSASFEGGYSYYGLWHHLTRVKWLLQRNRAAEAASLAQETLPRVERMADRNLFERMQLAAAEALGASGRPLDGAILLARTMRENPDPSLELVAEASRVAGCLATDDRDAARAHFARAMRIFHAIGQRTACADVQRRAGLDGTLVVDTTRTAAPGRVIETAAAVTLLAAHPPLLGMEVLDLLADARACHHAVLVEEDATGVRRVITARPESASDLNATRPPQGTGIPLGTLGERSYEVLVAPSASPTARATVIAVERMAHASVTLTAMRRDERERTSLWPEQSPEEQLGLVCASEAMVELVKTTRRVAPSNVTVLITGETGAGKEVIARALHQASGRQSHAFMPFNCTTVPREMLDAQLFGYRRGSFTGAVEEFRGLIRSAEGGTLFLDEIGEMPTELQPKLLRFLESGEILPLGETRPIRVDVRIVAATNADLDQLVNEGRFREDLFYRLNVVRLRVPPLRERREEVPLLVQSHLERVARETQRDPIRVSEEAMEYLSLYHWPGNARQLANELRRLSALAEPGALVMPEHLSPEIASSRPPAAAARALSGSELLVRTDQPLSAATEHVERVLIAQALDQCQGNLERAAQILGLSRKGLFLKRQRLGLF